jgi:outer membrane protein TolC
MENRVGNMQARILATWIVAFLVLARFGFGADESAPQAASRYYAGDPELKFLMDEALERNRAIRQSFSAYRASLQRLPQVGSLPDPVLGLNQYLRRPETRVGPMTTVLNISQKFPWFGKLSDREKIAAKEAAVSKEMHEALKAEISRQVKLAYYDLAFVDRAAEITRDDISLLEHYESLAQARYAQGVGLQQGVVKLQAEITRDRNRLQELRTRRVDAEALLNALRDRPAATPIGVTRPFRRPKVTIDPGDLLEKGRQNRPELIAALLQIEREDHRIELARKSYWPDITIGAGITNVTGRSDLPGQQMPPSQNGKNIYSFSVGVNIPIHRHKYDAGVLEATEAKIGSLDGYRSRVGQIDASIRTVGFRIQTLETQISLFERTLLPQAEQAMRSTETAYSTGSLGVLELLDSERVLLEVRLGMVRLAHDYMKALAEMERAIGTPFPEIEP